MLRTTLEQRDDLVLAEVLVAGEAAIEPVAGVAVVRVGDETRRRVALPGEELGQGRIGPSSPRSQSTESRCGHWPVNMLACEGSVQEAVDRAESKRTPPRARSASRGVVGRAWP